MYLYFTIKRIQFSIINLEWKNKKYNVLNKIICKR